MPLIVILILLSSCSTPKTKTSIYINACYDGVFLATQNKDDQSGYFLCRRRCRKLYSNKSCELSNDETYLDTGLNISF